MKKKKQKNNEKKSVKQKAGSLKLEETLVRLEGKKR